MKIAIIALVYTEILTSEGMILSFMRRLPDFFTCPYCIAGQIALWDYLFPSIYVDILFRISLPIAIVYVLLLLNERSQKNNRDSDATDEGKKVFRSAEIPIEPEKKADQ
jgi:membrane protein implicated in regulation of membrane protease activity